MRNFIHVNLCVSLFVAQLLFIVTVGMTEKPVSHMQILLVCTCLLIKLHNFFLQVLCQSIAVVLHYVFLVTFMWMLMEGVVLYVVLVQVFVKKPKLYMAMFTILSYGEC